MVDDPTDRTSPDRIADLFASLPATACADWRERVRAELTPTPIASLETRLAGGLAVEPLYGDRQAGPSPPGTGDLSRGVRAVGGERATRAGLAVESEDPPAARAALAAAIGDGLRLLWWRPGPACIASRRDLVASVEGLDLDGLALVIDAGAATAALVPHLAEAVGEAPGLELTLAVDPLAALAAGRLDGSLEEAERAMAASAGRCTSLQRGWRAVVVDSGVHRAAGATVADELAAAVATGLHHLRTLAASGLAVAAAAQQLRFVVSLGSDLFLELAKLRALRRLWSRCVDLLAGTDADGRAASIYARTATTERTVYGRWANQLRATAETFAAQVGGADGLVVEPFEDSTAGRRLALTVQHILAAEAHLGRVADPAGGSGYVEQLTDTVARDAWERVRAIERQGGMAAALTDGRLAADYAAAADRRAAEVACGHERWVGVSVFPDAGERCADLPAAAIAPSAADAAVLPPRRPTAALEAFRQRHDRLADQRPAAALIGLGAAADRHGALAFAARRLAAGGFAARELEGDDPIPAFRTAGVPAAVVCGRAETLRDTAAPAVERLRAAGARTVLLATEDGCEGDLAAIAGADAVLHPHSDLLAVLGQMAARLDGVGDDGP